MFGLPLLADTLKLKDGTQLNGRVMDAGSSGYWVKGADGKTQTVPKDSVQEWVKGDPATPAAASASAIAGRGQAVSVPGGAPYNVVKAKADRVDTPIQAVGLWQSFIDGHPSATDATAAKQQLAYWNQLMNGNAERINGKWIWGADREKLLKQVRELVEQASTDIRNNQIVVGVGELEKAGKLYPNDFYVNFELGYINLKQGLMTHNNAKLDAGQKAMEQAVKLRPTCAAALSDLAIVYNFKRQYTQSIQTAYSAVKIEDNKETVQNLVLAFTQAPTALRQNSKIKPIFEELSLLTAKYGAGGTDGWNWIRPPERDREHHKSLGDDEKRDDSEEKGPPGIIGNGTGEIVSADGYILTNRHVAKEGDYLMVRLSDGTMKAADRVVIDDDQDLAIIKIKTDATVPLPFVRLAAYDHPPVGADADVFGFPLLGMVGGLDSSVKMTRGIVTAWDEKGGFDGCDVTVDAAINPGNSGGPIVDHFGNLLAVATAKTGSGNIGEAKFISSYGLGQSTGHIRKFLAHQAVKLKALKMQQGTSDKQLTNEELATKLTPVTVCVFICRGAPPADGTSMPKPPAAP